MTFTQMWEELKMRDEKAKAVSAGLKNDAGKVGLELLDRTWLTETAEVLDFGAKKYAAHNWRKGIQWSRVLGAALRHLNAYNDGEDRDAETGLSHLAHASCCLMFLTNFVHTHPELDDRWPREGSGELVRPGLRGENDSLQHSLPFDGANGCAPNVTVPYSPKTKQEIEEWLNKCDSERDRQGSDSRYDERLRCQSASRY